jgi:6-methylsalicylate decarboxylase
MRASTKTLCSTNLTALTAAVTRLTASPPVLQMLPSAVGMDWVLFGSDYPYLRRDLAVNCRHEVASSSELDANESRTVLSRNALSLFPRFADHARNPKA